MKVKNIFLFILLSAFSLLLSAQEDREGRGRQHFDVKKHQQERADFIVKELKLTEAEKKAFIPLMEEYIYARFALNKEMRDATRELKKKTEKSSSDYQVLIDKELEMRFKEVELQKEYYKKFGKVISPEKVFKYSFAERMFTQRAVKRFHKHQEDK